MKAENDVRPTEIFAGTSMEANLVKGLLESADIMAFLKDDHMGTIAPWQVTGGGAGAVKVFVSETDHDRAKSLLEEGGYL